MKTKFSYKQLFTPKLFLIAGICLLTATACEEDEVEPPAPEPTPAAIVLPCDYFDTNNVLVNDTLKDVDYIIDCFMHIHDGAQVVIEEGVTIEFTANAGFYVDDDAQFVSQGSAEAPVTLSGTQKTKGYWRGIFINSNLDNSIQHTRIEYAGGETFTEASPIYEGSVAVSSGADLELSHVEILNGANIGLDLSGHTADVSADNLTISENEGMPVRVCAYNAHIFDSTSTFSGNTQDYINIIPAYYEIESTVSWVKLDVPYLVDGRVLITDNGFLTIEAGVEALFRPGAYLQAAGFLPPYNIGLSIIGTASEPVRLSAYNGNNWGGIYYSFTQENNLIKHAIIEHAKGDISVGNITNTGAIYMHADPQLTIEDTEFIDLPNCAYYAYTGASTNQPELPNFTATNLTLTNVAGAELCWGDGSE
ncbi:MAG: hypothetical protein ABR574_10880 [Cryomorphaceae bacterium]|nr:hypothetical protein [Flavobacteriales bacterium]